MPATGYPGYPQAPAGGYPGYPQAPATGYPGYPGMPGAGYPAGPAGYPSNVRPLTFEDLSAGTTTGPGGSMELLYGVNLEVTVEIGRTRLPIREVLALTPGSIVELDKLAGEKVDVLVNGHLIATGEVVVVDENFGVRITDVSARARRLAMGEGAA
jgi:flagellar motor switch protein FliN/FliY